MYLWKTYLLVSLVLFPISVQAIDVPVQYDSVHGVYRTTNIDEITFASTFIGYRYQSKRFTVEYEIENSSKQSRTLNLLFPVSDTILESIQWNGPVDFYEMDRIQQIHTYYDFQSRVDGRMVERQIVPFAGEGPLADFRFGYLVSIEFQAGEEKRIGIDYRDYGDFSGDYEIINEPSTSLSYSDIHRNQRLEYPLYSHTYWGAPLHDLQIEYNLGLSSYISANLPIKNDIYYLGPSIIGKHHIDSNLIGLTSGLMETGPALLWYYPSLNVEDNLIIENNELLTTSFGASELAGLIFHYIEDPLYIKEEVYFILSYINELIPMEQFKNLLIRYLDFSISNLGYDESIEDFEFNAVQILIRFLINMIHAEKGYDFTNQRWEDIFLNYDWYNPETWAVNLSDQENQLITRLTNFSESYRDQLAAERDSPDFHFPLIDHDLGK